MAWVLELGAEAVSRGAGAAGRAARPISANPLPWREQISDDSELPGGRHSFSSGQSTILPERRRRSGHASRPRSQRGSLVQPPEVEHPWALPWFSNIEDKGPRGLPEEIHDLEILMKLLHRESKTALEAQTRELKLAIEDQGRSRRTSASSRDQSPDNKRRMSASSRRSTRSCTAPAAAAPSGAAPNVPPSRKSFGNSFAPEVLYPGVSLDDVHEEELGGDTARAPRPLFVQMRGSQEFGEAKVDRVQLENCGTENEPFRSVSMVPEHDQETEASSAGSRPVGSSVSFNADAHTSETEFDRDKAKEKFDSAGPRQSMRFLGDIDFEAIKTTIDEATRPKRRTNRRHTNQMSRASMAIQYVQGLVNNLSFQFFLGLLILLNAFFTGCEADGRIKHEFARHQGVRFESPNMVSCETGSQVLCLLFLLELFLRILADGWWFVRGNNAGYNMFDCVVIPMSIAQVYRDSTGESQMSDVFWSIVSVARIMRLGSILLLAKSRTLLLQKLCIMVFMVVHSASTVLWAISVLFFVLFSFGLVISNGVAKYLRDLDAGDPEYDIKVQALLEHFDGVISTLYTLWISISGGCDWSEVAEPLRHVGEGYWMFFSFYVAVVLLLVLNVITGILVDGAVQLAQKDRDLTSRKELADKEAYMRGLREFFWEADEDESGSLSLEEFEAHAQDSHVKAYLSAMGLDISEARSLFCLLDTDGSNGVEIEEFVSGCMRAKGSATSIDLCTLLYETRKMDVKLEEVALQLSRIEDGVVGAQQAKMQQKRRVRILNRMDSNVSALSAAVPVQQVNRNGPLFRRQQSASTSDSDEIQQTQQGMRRQDSRVSQQGMRRQDGRLSHCSRVSQQGMQPHDSSPGTPGMLFSHRTIE